MIRFKPTTVALIAMLSWPAVVLPNCSDSRAEIPAQRQECSAESNARNLQEAHGYAGHGEYARAERVFANILACQRQLLPPDDLNVAVTLGNLGELKRLQRRFTEAEALLKEAGRLHEIAGRTEHPALGQVHLSLGSLYKDRKDFHRAEPLVRQAMQIFELSPGPESRESVAAMNTLAVIHADLGNLGVAERMLRALVSRRQNAPPDVSLATVHHNLGRVLLAMGSPGEAEESLRKALDLRSQLLGTRHPSTQLTLDAYAGLLVRTGRKAEARQVRKRMR